MNRQLRLALGPAIVLVLTSSSPSNAFPCQDCDRMADRCLASSTTEFTSCYASCLATAPVPLPPVEGCVASCELAWIYRNLQCDVAFASCWVQNQFCDGDAPTNCPLLVDLDRNNVHLSGRDDTIAFDMDADGRPDVTAWTQQGQQDAFLCLDRNGNGSIDDGSELFGDHTPLILWGSVAVNGYVALAEFDAPSLGGSTDGYIDSSDAIFDELCLWIDANHNGVSEVAEISSLASAGVERIALEHTASERRDPQGNLIRYLGDAWVRDEKGSKHTITVDVFFVDNED